ncbi:DUF2834 domain-containing protein [Leifsonia sp. LS-T14]|uniref:DUF2834 domain-containing protein n=1 Tax=unclassified Leifsonia TaxID=2663824 RepID=UPI0035A621CF
MNPRWNGRAIAYIVLALIGLVGTWAFNISAVLAHRDYLGDWTGSGPAVTSLTIDILVAAVAAIVFMVVESRRIGMRRVWIYILLIPLVALAFAFPLFLAMRERHLSRQTGGGEAADER